MKSRTERFSVSLLKITFSLIFIWFGALKLLSLSPAHAIIESALPYNLGSCRAFLLGLGVLEILIGISLLIGRHPRIVACVMILHLFIATLSVLITQGFSPQFPLLSLAGEFVIKNFALMAGGLIILVDANHQLK